MASVTSVRCFSSIAVVAGGKRRKTEDEDDWWKRENPDRLSPGGVHNSGDVLLSHNLEMHYHWGCSVSLPCSEWERVGPLRYDHQKAGEAETSPWGNFGGGLFSTSPENLVTEL